MDTRHPDVEHALDGVVHQLGRDRRLLGDGHVRGPGGHDQDPGLLPDRRGAVEHEEPRQRMVGQLGQLGADDFGHRRVDARHQDLVVALGKMAGNRDYLVRLLALAENHLREAAAQGPVMIQRGEAAEILVGKAAELGQSRVDIQPSAPDSLQEEPETLDLRAAFGIHVAVGLARVEFQSAGSRRAISSSFMTGPHYAVAVSGGRYPRRKAARSGAGLGRRTRHRLPPEVS